MTPALLLLLAVFALPMVQYAWLSTQAQTVLTAVSYTHLTLPTICSV